MLTKGKMSKFRAVKYVAMVLALVAVFAFCLTACGKAAPVSAEYVAGTLTKGTYNQGETFDCTGAQIKITYDNDATETVDVTAAMVGEVVLNTVGSVGVNVTYSTEGGSVTAIIPVTVLDPYAGDKAAAINAINANASVIANSSDKGVEALVNSYTAEIKAATSKADIDALASNFATKVEEYITAKADARNTINNVSLTSYYEQFLGRALASKNKALNDVDAATSTDAVKAIATTFVDEMAKLLEEQRFYIDTDVVTPDTDFEGQIRLKMEILDLIKASRLLLNERIDLVVNNGDPANVDVYVKKYQDALEDLDFWDTYIPLAINLTGLKETIQKGVNDALRTDIDDIYDAIRDVLYNETDGTYTEDVLKDDEDLIQVFFKKEGVVGIAVVPAPYVADEANAGKFILGTDTIGNLIAQINADYGDAVKEFGPTLAEQMYVDYKVLGTEIKINLKSYVAELENSYNVLDKYQDDAAPIIALIDAIETATDKEAAVKAAWDALKAWGTGKIFSEDASIAEEYHIDLKFDKIYDKGIYTVTQGEDAVTALADVWTAYDFTEEYMIKYFVPNYEELVLATIHEDAFDLKNLVENIPEDIVFSYTAVDSKSTIDTAKKARTDFIDHYGEDVYKKYCYEAVDGTATDVLLQKIEAAYKEHGELVEQAKALNLLIADLPAADKIVISDYEGEAPVLKTAYDAYLAFANRNNEGTTLHTDVIANVDNAGTTDNEAKLLACIDKYIDLAYAEKKEVIGLMVITSAYNARIGVGGDVDVNDTAFRTALAKFAMEEYDALLLVQRDHTGETKFNRMEIFKTNLDHVTEVAEASAKVITDAKSAADLTK